MSQLTFQRLVGSLALVLYRFQERSKSSILATTGIVLSRYLIKVKVSENDVIPADKREWRAHQLCLLIGPKRIVRFSNRVEGTQFTHISTVQCCQLVQYFSNLELRRQLNWYRILMGENVKRLLDLIYNLRHTEIMFSVVVAGETL